MKPLNILLVTRYFPPLDSIATLRMYAFAKYLARSGHKISVLTTDKKNQVVAPLNLDTSPFEVWEVPYFDPIVSLGYKKEGALATPASPSWKGKVSNFLKRIYQERLNERMPGRTDFWIWSGRKFLKKLKREGRTFDCVISSYGPPAAHCLGSFAKKIFGCKWIADYRDLWFENHVFKGVWPFSYFEKRLERQVLKRADLITTVSFGLQEVLQKKFPKQRVEIIKNGFDEELFDAVQGDYFSGEKNVFRIIYTGSIYRDRRDPTPLFQAVSELAADGLIERNALEILFYTSCASNLEELIKQCKVEDIAKIMPPVPYKEALSIQNSADLLLFLEDPNPKVDGILTGKLFEYLYASAPILAVGIQSFSEPGRLILKTHAGQVCGTDKDRIKFFLLDYLKKEAGPMEKSLDLIYHFSRKAQVAKLEQLLIPLTEKVI